MWWHIRAAFREKFGIPFTRTLARQSVGCRIQPLRRPSWKKIIPKIPCSDQDSFTGALSKSVMTGHLEFGEVRSSIHEPVLPVSPTRTIWASRSYVSCIFYTYVHVYIHTHTLVHLFMLRLSGTVAAASSHGASES